jgi:hypothetical protein
MIELRHLDSDNFASLRLNGNDPDHLRTVIVETCGCVKVYGTDLPVVSRVIPCAEHTPDPGPVAPGPWRIDSPVPYGGHKIAVVDCNGAPVCVVDNPNVELGYEIASAICDLSRIG